MLVGTVEGMGQGFGECFGRTHDDGAAEEELAVPAFEPCEGCVDKDGAEGGAQTGCEATQTDLHWVGWEHIVEECGEEVEHGVEAGE